MKVAISTWGRFHMFHLARQLERFGMLQAIYSTYPRFKLKDEPGIPAEKIKTDPVFQALEIALIRAGVARAAEWVSRFNVRMHDRWLVRNLDQCDVLVALSGSGFAAGPHMQRRGAKYICDRGSPHIRAEIELGIEEWRRFGLVRTRNEQAHAVREEKEYEAADVIVVPSRFAASSYVKQGIDPAKLRVVPYGANLARFYPEGRPDPHEFRVLFVGGIGLRKGVMDLFDAFARVRHPRKSLTLVGALQPEMDVLLKRVDLSGVTLAGAMPNAALRKLYSTAHVLVLPSISEGLAMVMGEALACGCPVIASAHTGAEDLFTDGVEGFIVPPRNPILLSERLQRVADDRELRDRMAQAALVRCQKIGGWDAYGASYRQVIEDVTAGPPAH
jgi:glycosyltransferase involved in cell wall biosynthesis